MVYKTCLVCVFILFVPLTSCVELDLIDCGIDNDLEVTVGEVEIQKYPFVGILYYSYDTEAGEMRATTTVVLIQKEFVITNAADIGPMPKTDFRKKTRVLVGEPWSAIGRRVRNYVLHPEYGETYNTIALVQLRDPVRLESIKPACPAPETLRDPVFYVMKFQPDYNKLQKEVIPVAHIPGKLCKEFYVKANLYSKKMRPPHVACAVSLEDQQPCVWESGSALLSRDVWGRWMLLGVGTRGPGCGAPSRFLDMTSYGPWVKYSLNRFQRVTITRINKQKYVLRSVGGSASKPGIPSGIQRFGACDPEEKVNLLYRETIRLNTDNSQYQFLSYNMSIAGAIEFTCLTLEMINGSGTSEMSIRHACRRENFKAPCYYYHGSIFEVSIFIMFSDGCLFEMYAWGHRKNMMLLDIQEWKWEEGSFYEDFTTQREEYRGQTYMTDYGFEPIDQKMWIPDYDLWTTTSIPPNTTSTLTMPMEPVYDLSTIAFYWIPTTSTTTARTKRTFKRKTTSTLIYFLWGVPRPNDTGTTDMEHAEPYFFYRKNATGYGGVFI